MSRWYVDTSAALKVILEEAESTALAVLGTGRCGRTGHLTPHPQGSDPTRASPSRSPGPSSTWPEFSPYISSIGSVT